MPDPYRKLTAAVVDIGTQLGRIADHLTTPDDIRCPTPETHNWGCGCPTDTSALRMELDGQRQKAGDLAETVKAQCTELEQARKDVAFSDEAARRASQLRQDMATERYALQEQRDQLAAAAYRAELAIEDYRGSLSHALGLGTSAPWDAIHARAAELHRDNGQLLGEQAACIEAEQRRDELAATLHDVLRHFTQKGHPGEPCLQTGWIAEKTVARWRAVLNPPATEEQPPEDTAECWRKEPHVPHTWTLSPEEGGVDCPGVDRPATKEQPGPAEQCRAGLGDNPARHCIRPARHTEDHTGADGWHWLEDIAVYRATEEQQRDAR